VTALTEPPGLAGAEPAELTGIRIGYARVSTGGQKPGRQADALTAAGCRRIFADRQSGKDAKLTGALIGYARGAGDTLVVPSMDRLSRSLQDLITFVAGLRRRKGRVPVPARGAGYLYRSITSAGAVRSGPMDRLRQDRGSCASCCST
jgi:Resolvase, N terminal domain